MAEATACLVRRSRLRNTGSVRLLEKCGFWSAGTVWYGEDEYIMLVLRDE